LNAKNIFAGQY